LRQEFAALSTDPACPSMLSAGEIGFEFEELFFSRTDLGGIIKYGNGVFQRIVGYSWDELLEKPHKIIRHGEMPRAVFWLLWDTIKQGKPIGAFVKNRAKDGCFYWVFAIVTPIEGGYLSVRLRPSSEVLAVVKREYVALSDLEAREQLAPAKSAELLLARLGELGFSDYGAFMAAALGAELASRDKYLGRPVDHAGAQFAHLIETAQGLISHADVIADAYAVNESVPFNFRVLAAQLGQDGAAIGIISSNYTLLSNEMKSILADFIVSARDVARAINDGYFLVSTARVQRELLAFFQQEKHACPLPRETEMKLLDQQQQEYRARAASSLQEISRKIDGFHQACIDMSRLVAGLDVTRIMGKVECSRHVSVKDRLDELLSDLEAFQRTIASALKEIDRMNQFIRAETKGLLAAAQRAA
jgi:aerotaxis receptor